MDLVFIHKMYFFVIWSVPQAKTAHTEVLCFVPYYETQEGKALVTISPKSGMQEWTPPVLALLQMATDSTSRKKQCSLQVFLLDTHIHRKGDILQIQLDT